MRTNNLILHFRPRTVPEKALRFTFTWGLGGTAVVLVLLLATSGILMKFVYQPVPDRAYASVMALQQEVRFGQFVRNVHHISANALVIVVFLHMLRVFFSGAFLGRRKTSWIIGLVLFTLVLAANFTGYLLPWDQLAYWAITISTGMLDYIPAAGRWLKAAAFGGPQIGAATLQIFFALHTAVIPLGLIIFLPYHFWRIRKTGGIIIPRRCNEPPDHSPVLVPVMPELLLREAVTALVAVAAVLLLAVFINAPLGPEANPGMSPNPTKAPWYFAGLQELLLHIHPLFAVFVIPLLAALALLVLPFIPSKTDTGGIWFRSRTGRRLALISAVAGGFAAPLLILIDAFWIKPLNWLPELAPLVRGGLMPTSALLTAVAGYGWLLHRKFHATRQENIQALFVLLTVGLLVLTVVNIWFRGPAMALVWPWQIHTGAP